MLDRALPDTGRVGFASDLARFGDRAALITATAVITYAELDQRVADVAERIGTHRKLIMLAARNNTDSVVSYLAALRGGHPILLASGATDAAVRGLGDAYDPDVLVDTDATGRTTLSVRRARSQHTLHPDLALVTSTSGSTGSAKCVRLSHRNLQSNADAIADFLSIRETDRAATTLPMSYCYGLSVINSHLARGAGIILTDLSVVDECFWGLFNEHLGTSIAGVPHTFDLLDRSGFAEREIPSLRYVTQAGGRMAPERVRAFAELGQRRGWDLFVMYGQTEATARIAYLPPGRALTRPNAIGSAIPGGRLSLADADGCPEGVGELIYEGPNVMLGYARGPADLARGRDVRRLHTGDLARIAPDGLFEIVGRTDRLAKLFGLRINLAHAEAKLAECGLRAVCVESRGSLVVATADGAGEAEVRRLAADVTNLPESAVRPASVTAIPRLPSGKLDLQAIQNVADIATAPPGKADADDPSTGPRVAAVRALFADLLGKPASRRDSFVSLGGDSLSYVEVSLRLERLLGNLPDGWHLMSIADLGRTARSARGRGRSVETNVLLRAVAIIAVVGSHALLFNIRGGAHLLIGIAGYNFARFQLTDADHRARVRGMLKSTLRIAIPSALWMAFVVLLDRSYSWSSALFVHNIVGLDPDDFGWRYWFIEALVYILIFSIALLSIGMVDRAERRFPFLFPLALLGASLLLRYDVITLHEGPKEIFTPWMTLWLFALGWAAARAAGWPQRALVVLAAVVATPGFTDNDVRVGFIVVGVALLAMVPRVRLPARLAGLAAALASSSLFIYLTHWQIYPLVGQMPAAALLAALGFGWIAWRVWGSSGRAARRMIKSWPGVASPVP